MNLSAPFIKRPVMTVFVMLAILVAGLVSYRQLPVSDLPSIEKPLIGVTAYYPGALPETMVNMVAVPLEKELMNVQGLKELSTSSSRGYTYASLEFDYNKNMDEAVRDVQAALNRVEPHLPKDMDRPSYHKKEAGQQHIMYLVLTTPTASLPELRNYSDTYIQPRLARIEGVAKVDAFGAPYSLKIRVNPDLMAARGISLDQVVNSLRAYNTEVPVGSIKTSNRTLTLELPGKIKHAKDLSQIPIASGPVYLRDIATIIEGDESEREYHFVTKDLSSPAMILGLKKLSTANTVSISKAVNKIVAEIQQELPPYMRLNLWFDRAIWIHESIFDVQLSLFFAFVLVVLVIFLSLGRISETIIPSLVLPMSLIGTFIFMNYLNFSIDILSLLALTLSVGFVVDDAIVVLENIVRHHEEGKDRLNSSIEGSKEICFTVISMTLSLVAVFIPILFLGGLYGRLFQEFSMTLAIAVLASAFFSLTLTPMLCSLFLSKKPIKHSWQDKFKTFNGKCILKYEKSLRWAIRHPKAMFATAFFCILLTFVLFNRLSVDLFPEEDRGFVWSVVNLPKGINNEEIKSYQKKIETLLKNNAYIESFLDISLENSHYYLFRLVAPKLRPSQAEVMKQIQEEINSIPGTQTFAVGIQLINMNREIAGGGNYQLLVRGNDIASTEAATDELVKKMRAAKNFPYVSSNLKQEEPKLTIQINEESMQKMGVSKKEIQSLLQYAFSGASIGKFTKEGQHIAIFLEMATQFQNPSEILERLFIKNDQGTMIPLKAIASWYETLGFPVLNRVDQLPAVTVTFSLDKSLPINESLKELRDISRDVLPSNVSNKLQGAAAVVNATFKDASFLILSSILIMYLVLGILYESFIHPLTILSSLPFACLGGVLTLIFFDESLSLFSLVGFLLLIGIVKKNGIMIIDYAIEARKQRLLSAEDAIVAGCSVRFRPIMMTTIAAIMGALPIALGVGDASHIRSGLGLVICGGLLFSQLFTLYITPIFYLMFEKIKEKFVLLSLKKSVYEI